MKGIVEIRKLGRRKRRNPRLSQTSGIVPLPSPVSTTPVGAV